MELERRRQEREAEEVVTEAVRQAEQQAASNGKGAEVSARDGAKPGRGRAVGRPKQDESERSCAERMGVAQHTVQKHDRTVDLGDQYPFMQRDWNQNEMLKAGSLLDKLPARQRARRQFRGVMPRNSAHEAALKDGRHKMIAYAPEPGAWALRRNPFAGTTAVRVALG